MFAVMPAHADDASDAGMSAGAAAPPTVVTPTRLRQPLRDVPASVTIITAEMLRRLGITSVADALRLVPGMQVTESSGTRILINYHGTNNRDPRRLNLLVDGISVYRPGFAQIYWTQLPVAIEDIERIEVTRGPSSAAYGPNSMMAIVNIISKHPADVERASFTGGIGSQERGWIHARVARDFGATTMHVAVSAENAGGYDRFDGQPDGHDTTRARRLLVRSRSELGERTRLDAEAAYVEGRNEIPFKSEFEDFPDKRLRDYYLGATLSTQFSAHHELQLRTTYSHHQTRQEWSACFPQVAYLPELFTLWRANPGYANTILMGQIPSGGTPADDVLAAQAVMAIQRLGAAAMLPLCGVANQNLVESRADIELQDTFVVSDQFRLVTGIGARLQRAKSETFFGGAASNRLYRLFGNLEYKPSDSLTVNVGAYAEHDRIVGLSFAPRAGINVHLAPGRSLRFAVSKGIRTPDLVEQQGNFTYTVRTATPGPDGSLTPRFYQSTRSTGDMRNEESISKEVGYLLSEPRWGLTLDLKVFEDRLKNLISEVVTVATFTPTNSNSTTLRGAEVQASVVWSPTWSGFFNYAYLDNVDATTFWERTQYSRHSGSVGVSRSLGDGWRWSVAYYGGSGNGVGESRYGRTDLTIGRRFTVGSSNAEANLTLRHLDKASTTYILSGPIRESFLDSRLQAFAGLRVSF